MRPYRARTSTLLLALLAAAIARGSPGPADAAPATTPQKPPAMTPEAGSYDIGLMLGSQLEHNGVVGIVSIDTVIRGLKDAAAGRVMTTEERDAALRFMHDSRDAFTEKNRAAGREFLERNGKQPGIMTMPSGLQYRVLAEGDPRGHSPLPMDDVTVRYRASLGDGTEIDRSDTHDRPATFRVNSVFKGWQEAFLSMRPGAKWQLFVPPELGYGSNPPPTVPPGALLIYEIELLRVEPAAGMDTNAAKRRPSAGGNAPAGTPTPR